MSILVPLYNVEPYIERCARSLFEQTYSNLELIFVDDCSTDSSVWHLNNVLKDYPRQARRVHIFSHERNRGNAVTRNTLFDGCHGDFLFWVDADDWVETDAVERLVAKQIETGADIITGRAYAYLEDKVIRCHDGWNLDRESLMKEIIMCNCGATLWRRLIRKSLYTEHGIRCHEGVDGRVDYCCMIPLLYYAQKVSGIDAIVYHYNMENPQSMSYKYQNIAFQRHYLESCRLVSEFLKEKGESNLYQLSKEMMVKKAHDFMMIHFRNRYRKGYQTMADYIANSDKTFWGRIQWRKWIVKYLERNYYLMYLSYPIRMSCIKPFLKNRK